MPGAPPSQSGKDRSGTSLPVRDGVDDLRAVTRLRVVENVERLRFDHACIDSALGDQIVMTTNLGHAPLIEDYATRLKLARSITIPYARHEILQERDDLRQQFWAAFDAFAGVGVASV